MEITLDFETFPVGEALRYLGCAQQAEDSRRLVTEALGPLLTSIHPRYLWRLLPLERISDKLSAGGLPLEGSDIRRHLEGCDRALLFCATLGHEADQLLRRTQVEDLSKAVGLVSCCTAAIEEVCDRAEEQMKARLPGAFFTTRYSPGYGDLPLTIQEAFLSLLEAPKRLGLCASDSSILTPRKSVAAIIGVSEHPLTPAGQRRCESCSARENCPYRKKEEYCGR